jgi:selenocysteine-specific elongation factor
MPSLVLGTAGHIDHGKSALVEALTGTDPDRLPEEKQRGVTIELGFARLDLPSGRTMGVVDVPGHERFVRQMVAGATGIDVVMLVVAADDGVMPQTREHLAIIDLLGISRGVVAITKSDLADEEWIELVKADVGRLLDGTSIQGAPIVVVSARTGDGLPDLLGELDRVADETVSRHIDLPMRLPVDRVFTIAGAGTVVTGTMWSGSAKADDPVEVFPGGQRGRVRGVQVHGESVERAHAGQRVAMNVVGIERGELARGDVIAEPSTLKVADRFDARFTYLGVPGSDKPFASGSRVHVNHGTREVLGRVLLMDAESLMPGTSGLAQLRLEEALVPRYGDRFIVRSYSPVYTIGGGMILDVSPPRRTRLSDDERALLEALLEGDLASAVRLLLVSRAVPMSSADVAASLGVSRASAADQLNRAGFDRLKVGNETHFVAPGVLDSLTSDIEEGLLAFHAENPTESGIATAALRDRVHRRLDARIFDALLGVAEQLGRASVDGGRAFHPKAAVGAQSAEASAAQALLRQLDEAGLQPPGVAELAATAKADVGVTRKVLGKLANEGAIVRVATDMYFATSAYELARARLRTALAAAPDGATAAQLREALGVSRKYAIPLLEYLDAQGFTKREGDLRHLRG